MMSDKEKRKSNPRRRLLIRLIIGFAIFGAVIAIGIDTLRPKGAQIVFIAPDDNGVDNIWIADLNNPENPRQLTFHETRVFTLQISESNSTIVYMTSQIWILNLISGDTKPIVQCEIISCSLYSLHPDEQVLAYEAYRSDTSSFEIHIYDLQVFEDHIVYEFENPFSSRYQRPKLQWIGNSSQFVFNIRDYPDNEEFVIYDIDEDSVVDIRTLNIEDDLPFFTQDGIYYAERDTNFINEQALIIVTVHATDKPDDPIFALSSTDETGFMSESAFYDWHPDNVTILVWESWRTGENNMENIEELNLYNIETGTKDTLLSTDGIFEYQDARFNYNASQIVLVKLNWQFHHQQIMLYDMETGEEIALPLFGHSPQWVNGGR